MNSQTGLMQYDLQNNPMGGNNLQQQNWIQQSNCCAQPFLHGYQMCGCFAYVNTQIRYTTTVRSADVAIDKVENGFLVEIKGKKYVANNPAEIAMLVEKYTV